MSLEDIMLDAEGYPSEEQSEPVVEREDRAPTVEFDASVNGHTMFAYYAPGCCGLRTFYGIGGNHGTKRPTPEEVLEGIVTSGVSGNVMCFTDAYTNGEQLERFKAYVEENKLGAVTLAPPVENEYTGASLYSAIFTYEPAALNGWLKDKRKERGESDWVRPENWFTGTDLVHMDAVYYQGGGRPKPAKYVDQQAMKKAFGG